MCIAKAKNGTCRCRATSHVRVKKAKNRHLSAERYGNSRAHRKATSDAVGFEHETHCMIHMRREVGNDWPGIGSKNTADIA